MFNINAVRSRSKLAIILAFVILAIPVARNSLRKNERLAFQPIVPNRATQAFRATVAGTTQVRIYERVGDRYKPGLTVNRRIKAPLIVLQGQDVNDFVTRLHFQENWITDLNDPRGVEWFKASPRDLVDTFITPSIEFYRGAQKVADLRVGSHRGHVRWYGPVKWRADGFLLPPSEKYVDSLLK